MTRLVAVAAFALVLGVQTGCESCDESCDGSFVSIDLEAMPRAESATVCLDDECVDLKRAATGDFMTGAMDVPAGEVSVDATIRDVDGSVLASYSEQRNSTGDECCGYAIWLVADGETLRWRD